MEHLESHQGVETAGEGATGNRTQNQNEITIVGQHPEGSGEAEDLDIWHWP